MVGPKCNECEQGAVLVGVSDKGAVKCQISKVYSPAMCI